MPCGFYVRRAIFTIIPDHIMRTHVVVAKLRYPPLTNRHVRATVLPQRSLLSKIVSQSKDSDDGSCTGIFTLDEVNRL